MKKLLIICFMALTALATKAQVRPPHGHISNAAIFNTPAGYPGGSVRGDDVPYTETSGFGEWTGTDGAGTQYDVTWQIIDSTLYYSVNLSTTAGNYITEYQLYIQDDYQNDHPIYCNNYQDIDWASTTTNASFSGSANLGQVRRDLFFQFACGTNALFSSSVDGSMIGITAELHYNQPTSDPYP